MQLTTRPPEGNRNERTVEEGPRLSVPRGWSSVVSAWEDTRPEALAASPEAMAS